MTAIEIKTLIDAAIAQAKALDCVAQAKNWQDRRVYVTLKSHRSDFRGCATTSIYFDVVARKWIAKIAPKGFVPAGFRDDADAFVAAVGAERAR